MTITGVRLYTPDPFPGDWEHKGGLDCPYHGENVVYARPKGSVQGHECVQCLLEIAAILERQAQK